MSGAGMTEREQAELLALKLELGFAGVAEVVSWADAIIARTDRPHWAVCELATMSRAHAPDVIAMLRQLPGVPDERRVRARWFESLADKIEADPRAIDHLVAHVLRLGVVVDDELERAIRIADYELELLESGVSRESRVSIARDFAASLRAAAKRLPP